MKFREGLLGAVGAVMAWTASLDRQAPDGAGRGLEKGGCIGSGGAAGSAVALASAGAYCRDSRRRAWP